MYGNKKTALLKVPFFYESWNVYSFSVSITFQIPAAIAAPTNGPTMNIQRLERAVPPWKKAGAKERAGFTDVPV